MRRLLAPLTRWLDRRIDARIAAASARRRGIDRLADMARDGILAAFEVESDRRSNAILAGLAEVAADGIRDASAHMAGAR